MAEAYRNQEDLTQRIDGTVCMWAGEPYYVRTVGKIRYPNVDLYKLEPQAYKPEMSVDHTDSRFVDRSFPVGYMNYNMQAYYLARVPYRQYNQSIRQSSLISSCGTLNQYDSGWFNGQPFYDMIKEKYPSVLEARNNLENGYNGVAISRDVAMKYVDRRILGLYYKDRLAAIWSRTDSRWNYQDGNDISVLQKIINKTGLF